MYRYKVIKNSLLTPTVRSVVLKAENNKAFLLEPGQYVAISMNNSGRPTTTRCFSVASTPTDRYSLEICARVKGKYTRAMSQLAPGDSVTIRGPFGHFVFNEKLHKRLVLFAGGIGITPFMSMIRYSANLMLSNNIHLIYSCRSEDDIPFLEELLKLEKENPNFHITFAIGTGKIDRLRDQDVILGQMGEAHLPKLGLKFTEDTYLVCGPSAYSRAMLSILTSRGIPSGRILSEAFSQGKHQHSDTLKRWPLNMYAMAGLSFSLAMFFVTAGDLSKTLPSFKENPSEVQVKAQAPISLAMIKPQVDTNISQKPIIKHVAGKNTPQAKVVSSPAPAVAKTVLKAPPPAPRPVTVTPAPRPKTQVS